MTVPQCLSYIAALLCLVGLFQKAGSFFHTGDWAALGLMLFYASLCRLFLFRRTSQATCASPLHWVAALAGTWLPLWLEVVPHLHVSSPQLWLGRGLQLVSLVLMNMALNQLGQGFGIIAAVREVKTQGLYRWVRHPLYATELLNFAAITLLEPTVWNMLIVITVLVCQMARARQEEQLLAQQPAYAAYMHQVRWRLLPSIW